jgi:hypothetical protein
MTYRAWLARHEHELGEAEKIFVGTLHDRASAWPLNERLGFSAGSENGTGQLLARLELADAQCDVILLDVGIYFDGSTVRADRLHSQLFTLEGSDLAWSESGPPERLAAHAARWFEAIVDRPIVRREWDSSAGFTPCEWRFADTGQALVARGRPALRAGSPARVVPVQIALRTG